jgi:ketosteroid isomerase-like protein
MKNRITTGLGILLIAIAISCTPKKTEEPVAAIDKDQIKKDIQGMEDAFSAAFSAHNADNVSAYYADDAKSFSSEKPPEEGKAAITAAIAKELEGFPKGATLACQADEIYTTTGVFVTEIGNFKMKDSTGTEKMSGHFISLFEKRNGKYVCIRDMATSDMQRPKK